MKNKMICLQVVLASVLIPAAAGAPLDWWIQAAAHNSSNIGGTSLDSGQVQQSSVSVGPLTLTGTSLLGGGGINGVYASSLNATAAPGHLFGTANASETFTQYQVAPSNMADAVRFFDTLTLSSPSLANGAFVDVLLTILLRDSLSSGPGTCCANTGANGTGAFSGLHLGDQAFGGQSITRTAMTQAHVLLAIGTPTLIGGYLSLDSTSSPGVNSLSGQSRVDLDDAWFYVDADPGITVTSASGHDYATPSAPTGNSVPEPASVCLVGAGLLAAVLSRYKLNR